MATEVEEEESMPLMKMDREIGIEAMNARDEVFEPAIISDNPTRHGEEEYDYLQLLAEVNHLASGGAITSTNNWLLDSSVLGRFRSPVKNSVLHLAAMHGNNELVDLVATQCPNLVFSCNKNGDTPLHVAAKYGHISTLGKLLNAAICANNNNLTRVTQLVGMKNDQGNIVLHEAMVHGGATASMVFNVLETAYTGISESCYELALNNVNNRNQSVLHLAVEARLVETISLILEKCPQSSTPKGISPLVAAIMKKHTGMLTMIVSKKQEWIHLKDVNGRLPLHCAASMGYHEGVAYLLEKCKTCSIERDKYGFLPLHLAASRGHVAALKELLGCCPNPEEMLDPFGRNILHIAAVNERIDVVRYILQSPTLDKMINQKDMIGDTPLHTATFFTHPRIVYALTWDHRVDLNMLNLDNLTALDIAIAEYLKDPALSELLTVIALESAGAEVGLSNNRGRFLYMNPEVNNEKYEKLQSSEVESLGVISTLIVTASVAACLAVPGEAQGAAHNLHKAMFQLFIFCITVSFFSSISATIIILWIRKGASELFDSGLKLTKLLIGAALITLALAFLAGIYTVISKLTWLATTFLVMALVFLAILCVLYILLLLPSRSSSKILRYISYYPFRFWAMLAEE